MNTIGCPANIEVLLWYHTRAIPHPNASAPAIDDATAEFLAMGVIVTSQNNADTYTTTPLGKAWVEALCNVPPPRAVFVDEQGRVLG